MTSELKCPICGGEIQYNDSYSTYDCKNNPSEHYASEDVWQALIQAKQDLEIATEALKDITIVRCGLEDFEPKAVTMTRIAEKALAQIEHIDDASKTAGQN